MIRKFLDTAHAIGAPNACLFAASRLLRVLFGTRVRIVKYYFTTQPIVSRGITVVPSDSFALAWADDGSPFFSQTGRSRAVIAARFAQGARCLLATASGGKQFAGFLWYVIGPYDEDEVRARFCPLPEGSTAWDFDVAIVPRYRMSRLFSYLWGYAGTELARLGVTQSISRISAFNAASLAAHRRLGATIVGEATFARAGRWQLMKSSLRPRWHLSWRDDQRPVLTIGLVPDSSSLAGARSPDLEDPLSRRGPG